MFIQTRGPFVACLINDYVLYIFFEILGAPWSSGAWGPDPNGPVVDPPLNIICLYATYCKLANSRGSVGPLVRQKEMPILERYLPISVSFSSIISLCFLFLPSLFVLRNRTPADICSYLCFSGSANLKPSQQATCDTQMLHPSISPLPLSLHLSLRPSLSLHPSFLLYVTLSFSPPLPPSLSVSDLYEI